MIWNCGIKAGAQAYFICDQRIPNEKLPSISGASPFYFDTIWAEKNRLHKRKRQMNEGAIRKGVTQAKYNDELASLIFAEILILSGAVAYYLDSWYVFGGMIIGLILCIYIPVINILMGIVLSCLWALAGAVIVCLFQEVEIPDPHNFFLFLTSIFGIPASQVVGGLLFISGLGAHLGAIEWARDVVDPEERNFS